MAGLLNPKEIIQRLDGLKSSRGTWENHWREIAKFVLPRKDNINFQRSPGQKRNVQIFDNTGMRSNELLASALHSLLTNPSTTFFELTTGNLELDQNDDVRKWLQLVSRDMHNVLNNSNFQTEIAEMYLDLCAFGTGTVSMEEDPNSIIRFNAIHIDEVFIDEDDQGRVIEMYRPFKWTARQIVSRFGKEILEKSRNLNTRFNENSNEKMEVIHAVYPTDFDGNREFPFISQHILRDAEDKNGLEMKRSGFNEFPFLVPRFTKAPGEIYGRGPGVTALPEVKVINKMVETVLKGAQKVVDPPLQLPDDGVVLPLRLTPGGLNFVRPGSDPIKPIFNDSRIDFGFQAVEEIRKRIRESFFVDQLQLGHEGPQKTATEILQRTEDSMRLMGPILGRMQSEFLRPMVDRLFEIMERKNLIEPAPEILRNRGALDVQFSSLIAKAQRVNEGQNLLRAVDAITPFAQFDPSVLDNINGDQAVKLILRLFSTPTEVLRDKKEVEAMRKDRADKAAAQAQADAQSQTAEDIGKAGPALAQVQAAQ